MLEHRATSVSGRPRFFLWVAIAAAAVVFGGFAPTYYLRSVTRLTRYPSGATVSSALPLLIHIHALVTSGWLVLLVAQTSLVAAGRADLHRRLGVAGGGLAVLLVALGVATAIHGARVGWNPGGPFADSLGFLIVTLGDILLFAGFVGAGLYYRRQREVHKRLMLLGTVAGLMWPAITRMPYVAPNPLRMFGLLLALVVAVPVRDYLVYRRVHPAGIWGGLIIVASFPLRQAIGMTDAWHRLAGWIIR